MGVLRFLLFLLIAVVVSSLVSVALLLHGLDDSTDPAAPLPAAPYSPATTPGCAMFCETQGGTK